MRSFFSSSHSYHSSICLGKTEHAGQLPICSCMPQSVNHVFEIMSRSYPLHRGAVVGRPLPDRASAGTARPTPRYHGERGL